MEKALENIKVFISNFSAVDLVKQLEEEEHVENFSKATFFVSALIGSVGILVSVFRIAFGVNCIYILAAANESHTTKHQENYN